MPRPLSTTSHAAVGQQRDLDAVAVAGQRLVDRVVDDLPDQVVQAALAGRADVHAGPLADRLEALEDLDDRWRRSRTPFVTIELLSGHGVSAPTAVGAGVASARGLVLQGPVHEGAQASRRSRWSPRRLGVREGERHPRQEA